MTQNILDSCYPRLFPSSSSRSIYSTKNIPEVPISILQEKHNHYHHRLKTCMISHIWYPKKPTSFYLHEDLVLFWRITLFWRKKMSGRYAISPKQRHVCLPFPFINHLFQSLCEANLKHLVQKHPRKTKHILRSFFQWSNCFCRLLSEPDVAQPQAVT